MPTRIQLWGLTRGSTQVWPGDNYKKAPEMSRNGWRSFTVTRATDRELKRGKDRIPAVDAMTLLGS